MESTERRFTVKVRLSGQVTLDFNDMTAILVLHIRKKSRSSVNASGDKKLQISEFGNSWHSSLTG